jgi:hypothetical protein
MIWPLRVILWVAILIIGYRGVMAIVLNETPADTKTGAAPASGSSSLRFPVTLGEAYALQFGQVYLNFDPGKTDERARQLATYIPSNVSTFDPQFGWNGSGFLRLESEQVSGIDARNANSAVVTLLATVNGRLIELGVPLYSSGSGIVVSGEPAMLPPPSTVQPPGTGQTPSDPVAQNALANQLLGFFQAYAAGDTTTLNRFLAPGASISGLGGAVRFGSIASITVPHGGATRDITVTVNWVLSDQAGQNSPQLAETYDLTVVDQQGTKWYVKEIRASTQPMGTQ